MSEALERAWAEVQAATGPERLAALDALLRATRSELADQQQGSPRSASETLRALHVGRGEAFQALLLRLERVSGTELPVLIEGELGTGKSLLARAIHEMSARGKGPLASFGSEGSLAERWRAAEGGSLLVPHVDTLSAQLQQELLALLETPGPRLLTTASSDLRGLAELGAFSPELERRLRVLHLRVPPLREQRGAIPLLAAQLLRRSGAGETASSELTALSRHGWPGNLRELEAATRTLGAWAEGGAVRRHHVERLLAAKASPVAPSLEAGEEQSLAQAERQLILARLEARDWQQQQTADSLGVDRKTLYRKIRRYGLTRG